MSCGGTPAKPGRFVAVRSFVVMFRWSGQEGTWCRSCALQRFRENQFVCLTRGWWGLLFGPLTNLYAVVSNLIRWRRFRKLAPVQSPVVSIASSKSLWRRPASYVLLAIVLAVATLAGMAAPEERPTEPVAKTQASGPIHDRFEPLTPFLAAPPPGWKLDGKDIALTVKLLAKSFKQESVVEAQLSTDGFLRGLDRQYFQESPRKVATLELWHFASPNGAAAFYERFVGSNDSGSKSTDYKTSFAMAGGGHGFIGGAKDDYGFFYGVAVRRVGDIVVHVRYASLSAVSRTDVQGALEWTAAGVAQKAVA
jgi:hypothetical protein